MLSNWGYLWPHVNVRRMKLHIVPWVLSFLSFSLQDSELGDEGRIIYKGGCQVMVSCSRDMGRVGFDTVVCSLGGLDGIGKEVDSKLRCSVGG